MSRDSVTLSLQGSARARRVPPADARTTDTWEIERDENWNGDAGDDPRDANPGIEHFHSENSKGENPEGPDSEFPDDSMFDEAEERAARGEGGHKRRGFWKEVGLLARLARSVKRGEYDLTTTQIAALIGTLAYVVSPIDAIPDVIPIIGLADDAGVVAATLSLLSYELIQYREWEIGNEAA